MDNAKTAATPALIFVVGALVILGCFALFAGMNKWLGLAFLGIAGMTLVWLSSYWKDRTFKRSQ